MACNGLSHCPTIAQNIGPVPGGLNSTYTQWMGLSLIGLIKAPDAVKYSLYKYYRKLSRGQPYKFDLVGVIWSLHINVCTDSTIKDRMRLKELLKILKILKQ